MYLIRMTSRVNRNTNTERMCLENTSTRFEYNIISNKGTCSGTNKDFFLSDIQRHTCFGQFAPPKFDEYLNFIQYSIANIFHSWLPRAYLLCNPAYINHSTLITSESANKRSSYLWLWCQQYQCTVRSLSSAAWMHEWPISVHQSDSRHHVILQYISGLIRRFFRL
jgi:hypothetical protein